MQAVPILAGDVPDVSEGKVCQASLGPLTHGGLRN